MDVLIDGRTQLVTATELIQGIHLCLPNSPEPFQWAMIDAMCTCQQKLDTKLKKLGIKIEYLYKIQ